MKSHTHLPDEVLVRVIDDELLESETASVESHLAQCLECKHKHQKLALFSSRLETLIRDIPVTTSNAARESLDRKLELQRPRPANAHGFGRALWRFGLGVAAAAALAVAVLLTQRPAQMTRSNPAAVSVSQSIGTIEVDGEAFVPVPYSNSSLPVNAPHIVQMRVPVSSLVAAGVNFEPISSEVARADGSVLADVLLGMDGQPLGVHLKGVE